MTYALISGFSLVKAQDAKGFICNSVDRKYGSDGSFIHYRLLIKIQQNNDGRKEYSAILKKFETQNNPDKQGYRNIFKDEISLKQYHSKNESVFFTADGNYQFDQKEHLTIDAEIINNRAAYATIICKNCGTGSGVKDNAWQDSINSSFKPRKNQSFDLPDCYPISSYNYDFNMEKARDYGNKTF